MATAERGGAVVRCCCLLGGRRGDVLVLGDEVADGPRLMARRRRVERLRRRSWRDAGARWSGGRGRCGVPSWPWRALRQGAGVLGVGALLVGAVEVAARRGMGEATALARQVSRHSDGVRWRVRQGGVGRRVEE